MKKTFFIAIISLLSGHLLLAQHAHFTTSGTIEFEKRINVYAVISKMITKDNESYFTPMLDNYKKNHPQFKVLKSTLYFANNKSLFQPETEEVVDGFMGNSPVTHQNNVIYSDFSNHIGVFQKNIFEDLLLIKDSTRKIKWKITDETREIAGFTCRRANGVMLDSVYVVAFYTTEITVTGGPESFNGLPGMILGVALPHENVAWFASKVTDKPLPVNAVIPPVKGKPMTNKMFLDQLRSAFKGWGDEAQFYNKAFLL